MRRLRKGDPVTVLAAWRGEGSIHGVRPVISRVLRGTPVEIGGRAAFSAHPARFQNPCVLFYEEEGTAWCRGHNLDGDRVKAMITAWALKAS